MTDDLERCEAEIAKHLARVMDNGPIYGPHVGLIDWQAERKLLLHENILRDNKPSGGTPRHGTGAKASRFV